MNLTMHEKHLRAVDLNLLPVLDALLRHRNATRAGDEVGLSQPAMSRALGRLRALLDDPLLIRGLGPVPALGIAGSALATAIANFAGSAMMIWKVYARDMPLRLRGAVHGCWTPLHD